MLFHAIYISCSCKGLNLAYFTCMCVLRAPYVPRLFVKFCFFVYFCLYLYMYIYMYIFFLVIPQSPLFNVEDHFTAFCCTLTRSLSYCIPFPKWWLWFWWGRSFWGGYLLSPLGLRLTLLLHLDARVLTHLYHLPTHHCCVQFHMILFFSWYMTVLDYYFEYTDKKLLQPTLAKLVHISLRHFYFFKYIIF